MRAGNDDLIGLCSRIALDVDIAKQAKEVWGYIGAHADAINTAKFGAFFGVTQRAVLHEMALAICRIFDASGNANVASIRRATNLLGASELKGRDHLVDYLITLGASQQKIARLSDDKLLPVAVKTIHNCRGPPISPTARTE